MVVYVAKFDESYLMFAQHMIAGASAGMGEHMVMFPVDTIKTRMQALAHPGQQLHTSLRRALQAVLHREGIRGLYKGVTAVALGAGPSHALYFASYEAAKDLYGGNEPGHQPIATAAAGVTATIVNDGCMTPWDVVKQRMQVSHSPYSGVVQCIKETYRQEGARAFFKSFWTTLVMNVPYTAIHFATYESCKTHFSGHVRNENGEVENEGEETLAVQLGAGGIAGGIAAAATTPLDVVKTRLQLEGVHSATRYGTIAVRPIMARILKEEGLSSLFRGWQPRVLFHIPSAAICWGIYESFKSWLAN
jgi:solute carrier family 25 iron transporter 28/37